ncbi:PLDc N-terminal domain-containing protein [Virgibacillus sp. W0181]|uniref:PLDc N-terminal domain-containing protein n=1 Tax=Virgibacillus sp. W0181 TaxID=3391581 RepID=UPI003F482522
MEMTDLFMILAPLIIIQLILLITALVDLVKRAHTLGPKWLWVIIIIFVNIIGPILYFVIGRKDS